MDEKINRYVNGIFSSYEDLPAIRDLKEELLNDLLQRIADLKSQGLEDEAAYQQTIDSVGDISETIADITAKTRVLVEMVEKNLSMLDLRDSDFKRISIPNGKFEASDLRGSDFSGSNLTGCSFKYSDMRHVRFDGADLTGAKLSMIDLDGTTFKNCILDRTDFSYSDLTGVCFDNLTLNGTIFKYAALKGTSFRNATLRNVDFYKWNDLKNTIFDDASMDKLTYALSKRMKAHLESVTVI